MRRVDCSGQDFLKEEVMYTYDKRPKGILFDEMLEDAVVQ